MQHIFGYARVSATDQNLDTQLDDLTRTGCSRIFQVKVSGTRTPAGKMIIGVFSSFNQYERENNREKSLAGIHLAKQQGKHLGRPAGRDTEKLTKVAKCMVPEEGA